MNESERMVNELVNYVQSHLMSELKTKIAVNFVLLALSRRGPSVLYLDKHGQPRFHDTFKIEVEAILLGVYGCAH